ncbi:hypothetical protein halTADL_2992 [Halohasta litchfieldiae]|jgi:cytochrome bd-type quinol oxidase subunit 2|uniref:Uncharacterized protein n=1 Tax=Halohasta litchfieldiae TaxID=1073996 RepID=A0A1H6RNK1_9EURY|nr:hypothetical protein halTADL_2992 [Halohasta litchfieldiae]SEI54117.1 hypothetical protein SAMN05444271_102136 [Halohasta litchfieldiae]
MADTARTAFTKRAVLTVIVGFTLAGIFGPPDPFTQLSIMGVCTAVGLVGSYWLTYKSTVDLPNVRWSDLFRWYVSTLLFAFLILIVTDPIATFGSLASQLFQLSVWVVGAGLAWIVVNSDSIPWPGDT